MSAASTDAIFRNPGTIIKDPSSLTPGSYGGTTLGTTRMVRFREGVKTHPITAEEWGGQAADFIRSGEGAILAAILRGADVDAWTNVMTGTSTGTSGNPKTLPTLSTQAHRPGSLMSLRECKILFVPDSPQTYPAVLLYAAIPCVDESAQLSLSLDADFEIGAVWKCIPDASYRTFAIGKLEDLTL